MRLIVILLLCLIFSISWASLTKAAIPDLSKFKDSEPDVVGELKKLHEEKVLPVIKEVTKEILRPEFDATRALAKLNQMKDEYQSDGQFLIRRYSSQAQYKKVELNQVDKIVTSEIHRATHLLRESLRSKPEQPYLTVLRQKNQTLYDF